MPYCQKCGNEFDGKDMFCRYCGAELVHKVEQSEPLADTSTKQNIGTTKATKQTSIRGVVFKPGEQIESQLDTRSHQVYLTNLRLILVRRSKIIDAEYSDIERIEHISKKLLYSKTLFYIGLALTIAGAIFLYSSDYLHDYLPDYLPDATGISLLVSGLFFLVLGMFPLIETLVIKISRQVEAINLPGSREKLSFIMNFIGEKKGTILPSQIKEVLPIKKKSTRLYDIARYAIIEAVAIIGGLPPRLFYDAGFSRKFIHEALWDTTGALIAFLVIAVGVNLHFIRNQTTKVQVTITIILVGVLLATALGVKAWNW